MIFMPKVLLLLENPIRVGEEALLPSNMALNFFEAASGRLSLAIDSAD